MYIKFKDTLIKENLASYIMVLCALASGILGLFFPPINWTGVVWAFAAAVTAFDLVIVDTVRLQEKRELKQDLQHKNVYIAKLEKQRSDYAEKYLTTAQDLDNANQKVEELTRAMEAKAIQKTPRKRQKRDYTEQDQARIREEMKAGGMIKEKDEE